MSGVLSTKSLLYLLTNAGENKVWDHIKVLASKSFSYAFHAVVHTGMGPAFKSAVVLAHLQWK